MAATMSTTTNYSGMLYTRVDEKTRFLDSIYSRGRNGGRVTNYDIEFVLASGYSLEDPEQPDISETESMTAPPPETTERDQEYNVNQIFHKSVDVSYVKQSNRDMLGGINTANASNNVPNELDFQIGKRIQQLRLDLNYTLVNGVYQYTKGSTTVAPRTRGLITGIQTNRFDAAGAALSKNMVNDAIMNAIANGIDETALEIWVNPAMLNVITDTYVQIPGSALPASRTEGGIAYTQILTNYGTLAIFWDPVIPDKMISFVNMGQMAVSEKPYFDEDGNNLGVLFYEPLAKLGASERGQIYGELGCDYGAEWHHALIENIG